MSYPQGPGPYPPHLTPNQQRYPQDVQYGGMPMGGMPMGGGILPVDTSSGGNTVFIFGILGFAACALLAPVAWYKGNEYIRTCAAMGVQPSGLGVAGRILGIVGTILNAIAIVIVILSVVAGAAAG